MATATSKPSAKAVWPLAKKIKYGAAAIGALLVLWLVFNFADIKAQATPDDAGQDGLTKRYVKVNARDFDGDPKRITEADALIAYLQVVGTMVDFKLYDDKANVR